MERIEVDLIEPNELDEFGQNVWQVENEEILLSEDVITVYNEFEVSLEEARELAKVLLSAVKLGEEYREDSVFDSKGRQIVKSVRILDNLPEDTIIRDNVGDVLTKQNGGWKWADEFSITCFAQDGEEIEEALPATVLWNPELESEQENDKF